VDAKTAVVTTPAAVTEETTVTTAAAAAAAAVAPLSAVAFNAAHAIHETLHAVLMRHVPAYSALFQQALCNRMLLVAQEQQQQQQQQAGEDV
jgi:hypothetical protein